MSWLRRRKKRAVGIYPVFPSHLPCWFTCSARPVLSVLLCPETYPHLRNITTHFGHIYYQLHPNIWSSTDLHSPKDWPKTTIPGLSFQPPLCALCSCKPPPSHLHSWPSFPESAVTALLLTVSFYHSFICLAGFLSVLFAPDWWCLYVFLNCFLQIVSSVTLPKIKSFYFQACKHISAPVFV